MGYRATLPVKMDEGLRSLDDHFKSKEVHVSTSKIHNLKLFHLKTTLNKVYMEADHSLSPLGTKKLFFFIFFV